MNRLKFATEHVIWTEEQWVCVYFSDESKFNHFGCDGKRFIRHSPKEGYVPQCSKSSVKFRGGSVMIFGMISAVGTGPLVRLQGKIIAIIYKEIVKKHVVPHLRTAINQLPVFMQDNASCHTAKSAKTFRSAEDVTVMEWPVQRSDMNPIENVWKLLNKTAKKKSKKFPRTWD